LGGSTADLPAEAPAPQRADAEISILEIRPNPHQPRETFDPEGLEELRDSIRRHGVLQPVVVRAAGEGYELIAGERRWRAARLAGLERIPALIKGEVSDEVMLELALVENVQRRDLDAIEKARGYRNMMEQLGLTQEQVAEKVGLKRATVANHLRLLDLPEDLQGALVRGLITMGHARALLALEGSEAQAAMLGTIVREGLSVRQVEARVRAAVAPPSSGEARAAGSEAAAAEAPGAPEAAQELPWVTDLQRRMQIHLGTKVQLQNREGYKGKIVIDYYGREDLERLLEILAPREEIE
jgi:ParB family chromosome partitioning protein